MNLKPERKTRAKVHIKKGDKVYILSGKDRGATGEVLTVIPSEGKVIVEGVNVSTKHKKPRQRFQQGGIIHQETAIYACKCMLVCPKCSKPTKVGKKILESGEKVRVCKRCGETIDSISTKKN